MKRKGVTQEEQRQFFAKEKTWHFVYHGHEVRVRKESFPGMPDVRVTGPFTVTAHFYSTLEGFVDNAFKYSQAKEK